MDFEIKGEQISNAHRKAICGCAFIFPHFCKVKTLRNESVQILLYTSALTSIPGKKMQITDCLNLEQNDVRLFEFIRS
jgi:hypothetical protein